MNKLLWLLFALVTLTSIVVAQQPAERRGQGYVFVGPGATSDGSITLLNFGVGGEGLVYQGLGVGAEIGGFVPTSDFGAGLGVLSPNASYHFLKVSKSGKVVPFVTGGYSLFFRSGVVNAVNFGGGVNYWFKDRVGVRFEIRDHVWMYDSSPHFVGFRVGLAFR